MPASLQDAIVGRTRGAAVTGAAWPRLRGDAPVGKNIVVGAGADESVAGTTAVKRACILYTVYIVPRCVEDYDLVGSMMQVRKVRNKMEHHYRIIRQA